MHECTHVWVVQSCQVYISETVAVFFARSFSISPVLLIGVVNFETSTGCLIESIKGGA